MKKTLYPKTTRIKNGSAIITEKLDGSNLGFFKLNGEIIVAQRNYVFKIDELTKENSYKGLIGWLNDNEHLLNDLHEGSGVFGEWIGMGKILYQDKLDKKFYIFAKANIDENLDVRNINYDRSLFIYPFSSQLIPECMGVVPRVDYSGGLSISELDDLYTLYKQKVNRDVEGFIINQSNTITKYVRHKNGQLTEHKG